MKGIKDKNGIRTPVPSRGRSMIHTSVHDTFLTSPLIDIFMEANLSTKAFNQVLEETFVCPEGTNEMMKHLLVALQRPHNISPIQLWQLGDITAGWRKG